MSKATIAATLYGQIEACRYTVNGVLRELDNLDNPYAEGYSDWEGVGHDLDAALDYLDGLRKEPEEGT